MAFKTYRQQDAPWGSKNYNGSGTVGANGCGPTSCAIIVSYLNPSVTPTETVKYMQKHNYAIRGNGTAWAGITACLKAYGFDAKNLNIRTSMKPLWDELAKNKVKCGILLFSKGTRGGVTWTKGGHFVAFTDYKVKKGKHYLYTRDPNKSRRNDGWHCYETTMRGLLPTCFVAVPKSAPVKKTYTGEFPTIETTKKNNEECINSIVNWAVKIANDNTYGYKKWTSNEKTHQCPICHKGSGNGWNCIGFVSACFYHGGKVKSVACNCSGIVSGGGTYKDWTLAKFKARNGNDWIEVKSWKKGDVIVCFGKKTEKYKHTALGYKEGYVVDATSTRGITVRKTTLPSYKVRIFRYTGQQKSVKTIKSLVIGDSRKAEVKKLQEYLAWYGYSLEKDGKFGNNTEEAVKEFQKAEGLSADGKFGSKSLAKAKAVKR